MFQKVANNVSKILFLCKMKAKLVKKKISKLVNEKEIAKPIKSFEKGSVISVIKILCT